MRNVTFEQIENAGNHLFGDLKKKKNLCNSTLNCLKRISCKNAPNNFKGEDSVCLMCAF